MTLVIFAYGQVYFVFGLAIALQQRGLSNFRLARYLWLLAAFGIIHGMAEWGEVFIPIQGAYLSAAWIDLLTVIQRLAWALSYTFLLQFAVMMIAPRLPLVPRVRAFVRWYAPLWSAAVILTAILFLPAELGESWIRYLLGFPAAALTAVAFIIERQSFMKFPSPTIKFNLTMTAVSFGLYAILTGMVVPELGVWPLSWLRYQTVYSTTGLPIQFYRTLVGLAIAFFVIRTLSVFDLEIRHRLEATEKKQALLEDRQRIARDLHDGVIQNIYGANLQLEATVLSLQSSPNETVNTIRHVMKLQKDVIADIRRYIYKLSPAQTRKTDFKYFISRLVDEFNAGSPITARLEIKGDGAALTQDQKQHIGHVVRECLCNVSKHSLATKVDIELHFDANHLNLSVKDDGIGIDRRYSDADRLEDHDGGLGNIAARARIIGADLSITNISGEMGTAITMHIPCPPAASMVKTEQEESGL